MAAKKKPVTDAAAADEYYQAIQSAKIAAGLTLADAIEVTARQRAEDEANPDFIFPGTESESLSE